MTRRTLGALPGTAGGTSFTVWAPFSRTVKLCLSGSRRSVLMERDADGYHRIVVPDAAPGDRYFYRLDSGAERPDPASRLQPEGVHGPSQVVESVFEWSDANWGGRRLEELVIYELHVGTFSDAGTFAGVVEHLDALVELGVTAIELMPVAQFPGRRNWGYDGVCPFAVQASYGGPTGLKQLVDACHRRGLAVILDVVYNHLGPEGNYLAEFGPYFSDRYRTPWGRALNFDGAGSDHVRRYFVENALEWITEFHIDGLRLDAVHAIFDFTPRTFLEELAAEMAAAATELRRRPLLIAESSLNDPRLLRGADRGGVGLDAQWNDDFHHALHAVVTGEGKGYYQDYGRLEHLATALRQGYVFTGQYSLYRGRRHGAPCRDVPARRFVVFAQNHDQVGNRARGDRLAALLPFDALKVVAGLVLLSPFVPLLFMGEEYGETAPYPYFVDHSDPDLLEAVRRGRQQEFASFGWTAGIPDPAAEATFAAARLDHTLRGRDPHRRLWSFHRDLLRLRREVAALAEPSTERLQVTALEPQRVLLVRRWTDGDEAAVVAHLDGSPTTVTLPLPSGRWVRLLDSAGEQYGGAGHRVPTAVDSDGEVQLDLPAWSVVLLRRTNE